MTSTPASTLASTPASTPGGPVDAEPPLASLGPARTWALWLLTALGFPVGGLPAIALGGVDDVPTAVLGGAAAGLVIGAGQWLVLRRAAGTHWAWVPATAAGLALGLAVGAALVGYGTGAVDLVVQGAVSGAGVGLAQGLVLRRGRGAARALVWALTTVLLWPLGWSVTRAFGVSVEDQFAVFGATGALTVTVLSGAVLVLLLREPAHPR
jgi:hypothetical protein